MIHRRRATRVVALLLTLLVVPALAAAEVAGHWEGAIQLPTAKLGVLVDLVSGAAGLEGRISIPLQNAKDLPLVNLHASGDEVGFEIAGIPGAPTFQGKLAADGQSIAGQFTQSGGTFPFELHRAARPQDVAKGNLGDFPLLVKAAMEARDVPGLALAIVQNGEVIFHQGFGWRDVERKEPVTTGTLFAIGSCTKAFTSFVLGTLVDEGKLDWDKPVVQLLPGFALYDRTASEQLATRDMLCHRSGLPRHDLVWYNNLGASRRELVARLRYLEPNQPLRAKWQYNNLMFMTAGYLAEQLTGKSWEDNVRERIFTPLGMTHSNFAVADSQQAADFAAPYRENEEQKLEKIPFRPITNMGPAGSINSTADDMAEWVKLHLGNGKRGDRTLISPGTLAELHRPQMVMGENPERPEITPASYAMGWEVDTYRGHPRVYHGGAIDGFAALVTLFPQDGLGFVVLANRSGANGLEEDLVRHAADRILKLAPIDWNGEALRRRAQGIVAEKEARATKGTLRKPGTRPAHKLEEYAGEYENPGYGVVRIAVRGAGLEMTYNDIVTPLEHWHYETWNGLKAADPTFEDMRLQFRTDLDGEVAALEAPFEPQVANIVFTRKPDARLSDPAYLRRFAGSYDLQGEVVTVELVGTGLTLTVPGQPTYHLVPGLGGLFKLKEYKIIGVAFASDAQGRVTGLELRQPEGIFKAKRRP